ncbi:hypothetical protein CRG98_015143 [Punica granatum]|uniref:Uncharacterized protein n=1 Tax=Punica granatum TaxID=22663 RepID=A0A2I0K7D9_PUNGR|nr:hypothetical protein CRG98_015143 [Punica granatum]
MDYLREEEQQLLQEGQNLDKVGNLEQLGPVSESCPSHPNRGRQLNFCLAIIGWELSLHEMKGHLNDFGYKEPNRMWYLLPESNLDADLVDMNIDPDVMSMAEVGLKYEIVTVYTEADRMEDSSDDGMDARVAGDGDEDDTNDDVWEVEDVKRMRLRRMTLS